MASLYATLIGIPLGVTNPYADTVSFGEACAALPTTFGVIFTAEGLASLFTDAATLPLVLITIFSFSISDTFDTIGTFIGTGRRSGIFSDEDEKAMESRAASNPRWTRPSLQTQQQPPSALSSAPPTPPPLWKAFRYRSRRTYRPDQRSCGHLLCN